MIKNEFISAVKSFKLNTDEYIVIGSGVLCALEIREADDVDLIVSEKVFQDFEASGKWQKKLFDDGSYYLLKDIYEIGLDWDSQNSEPNIFELKKDQIIIEDIPFITVDRLKSWKLKKGRAKDLADIKLIDEYLST